MQGTAEDISPSTEPRTPRHTTGPLASHFSPAPLSFTFFRQDWTNGSDRSPILARIAIVDGIDKILKIHVGNACEPMHKTLYVGLATGFETHGGEKASKEALHFCGTAKRGDCFEP